MSRTKKGSKAPGYDFGAKYSCDHRYGAGKGKVPKDLADSERRNEARRQIKEELKNDNKF